MNHELDDKTIKTHSNDAGQYTGEYKNGQRHGNGILCWSDGTYYDGQFINGFRHGKGKMIIPCQNSTTHHHDKNNCIIYQYDGNFHQGKRHGYGEQQQIITSSNNNNNEEKKNVVLNTYMGQWKNDQINGKGYMKMKDGKEYAGEFQNGNRQGYGFLMYTNGTNIILCIRVCVCVSKIYSMIVSTVVFDTR